MSAQQLAAPRRRGAWASALAGAALAGAALAGPAGGHRGGPAGDAGADGARGHTWARGGREEAAPAGAGFVQGFNFGQAFQRRWEDWETGYDELPGARRERGREAGEGPGGAGVGRADSGTESPEGAVQPSGGVGAGPDGTGKTTLSGSGPQENLHTQEPRESPAPPGEATVLGAGAAGAEGGSGGGEEAGGGTRGSMAWWGRRQVLEDSPDAHPPRERDYERQKRAEKLSPEARRALLEMSVSGDNTKWKGWENQPQMLSDPRSGPEARVGRGLGNVHVTRPGGYWQASRNNRAPNLRAAAHKLPADFMQTNGEGLLDGVRCGINQHDLCGVDKPSGWPGLLHGRERCESGKCSPEMDISLDPYPMRTDVDSHTLQPQPFVVGVTSYSPDQRSMNAQYRSVYELAYLSCPDGSKRCPSTVINTVTAHSFKVGDMVHFEGVLGQSRHLLNCGLRQFESDAVQSKGPCLRQFEVKSVSETGFMTTPGLDTLTGSPDFDVRSALAFKSVTSTSANPNPVSGEHDWSYEQDDVIYILVTFSEPVVVHGKPALRLNTGDHFERGSRHALATFVGGGYGEKKTFWRNNEQNPLGVGDHDFQEDLYPINSGGCRFKSGFGGCAAYSGITKTEDAVVRLQRNHDFNVSDLITVQGVTGPDAALLNGQHVLGSVGCAKGSSDGTCSGYDEFTFMPPLDLEDKDFDASLARVGIATLGRRCRSHGVGDATSHGRSFCTFHTYAASSSGLGPGSVARSKYDHVTDPSGRSLTLRREILFNEERFEQSMDRTLAFEFEVVSGKQYDFVQTFPGSKFSSDQDHLTSDLDYMGTHPLVLQEGSSIKRACPGIHHVKNITTTTGKVTVSVYGKHQYVIGDEVFITGIDGVEGGLFEGKFVVQEIQASHGTSKNRGDWEETWGAEAQWGGSASSFQINVDADPLRTYLIEIHEGKAMVRKRYQTQCEYNDADLKFPKPGDKMRGEYGYLQSLSFNKDIVVGRSYVTNVTADVPDGTYGYNAGVKGANTVPDVIDIKVAFSEPVVASCGAGNCECGMPGCTSCVLDDVTNGTSHKGWTYTEHYTGLHYRVCYGIRLVLSTKDNATIGIGSNSDPNLDSTTGVPGEEIFPTSFLYENSYDPPNVLNFRYVVRRNDATDLLQYSGRNALQIYEPSSIRRRSDNKPSGVKLPPTKKDSPDFANHPFSLSGTKSIKVSAEF